MVGFLLYGFRFELMIFIDGGTIKFSDYSWAPRASSSRSRVRQPSLHFSGVAACA